VVGHPRWWRWAAVTLFEADKIVPPAALHVPARL